MKAPAVVVGDWMHGEAEESVRRSVAKEQGLGT